MRKLISQIVCAALVAGGAGCIVERDQVVPDAERSGGDPGADGAGESRSGADSAQPSIDAARPSSDAASPSNIAGSSNDAPRPPRAGSRSAAASERAAGDGGPPARSASSGSQQAATMPDASPQPAPGAGKVARDAAQADAELEREGARHRRPLISNLDAHGEPLPGTTGEGDASAPLDEEVAQGAPGANASPEALARAWPSAKVVRDPGPPSPSGSAESEYDEGDDPTPPAAGTELDPSAFERPLRSYGRWVDTADQGRVWIPYVDGDWQPYSDGAWSDTEYGWTFTSYEPWGWAVFHYGRWGFRGGIGWYWVPGRVWGPAWVSWRWGGGYAVWRPMAPRGAWNRNDGRLALRGWVGVPAARFTEPLYASSVLRGRAVQQAVARAAPLAGPLAHPVAGSSAGPPVGAIAQAAGHPILAQPATAVLREANVAARSAAAQESRAGGAPGFSAPRATGAQNWRSGLPAGAPRGGARGEGTGARGESSPRRDPRGNGSGDSPGRTGEPGQGGATHGAAGAHPVEPGGARGPRSEGSSHAGASGGRAAGHPAGRGAGHHRGGRR